MWILLYSVAAFLDILGALLGFFAIGIIVNRIITFFAFGGFLLTFITMGVDLKKVLTKLTIGSLIEALPIAGEIIPGWLGITWRIHKSQSQPVTQEAPAGKEEMVAEQTQEDHSHQEQLA